MNINPEYDDNEKFNPAENWATMLAGVHKKDQSLWTMAHFFLAMLSREGLDIDPSHNSKLGLDCLAMLVKNAFGSSKILNEHCKEAEVTESALKIATAFVTAQFFFNNPDLKEGISSHYLNNPFPGSDEDIANHKTE